MTVLTKTQARMFILAKQGLLGSYRFSGKDGAYAYATMNYRYIDDDTDAFDIMYDVFLALEEIKKTAEENDVELTKVLLTGASAGGHIALLYAYSYFYISPFYSPIIPTCVVSFSGPAVIYNQDYYKMAALGGEAYNLFSKLSGYKYTEETYEDAFQYLAQVSPVYYTHPVPTLICHGEKDSVVPVTDAYQLDSFLTTFDVEHDLLIFPNSNHGLESDPDVMEQAQRLFKEYMVKYL